jgi:hypothetical protein
MSPKSKKKYNKLILDLKKLGIDFQKNREMCPIYVDTLLALTWSIEDIIIKICQMKYLFEYCNMRKYIAEYGYYFNHTDHKPKLKHYISYIQTDFDKAAKYALINKNAPDINPSYFSLDSNDYKQYIVYPKIFPWILHNNIIRIFYCLPVEICNVLCEYL